MMSYREGDKRHDTGINLNKKLATVLKDTMKLSMSMTGFAIFLL